MTLTRVTNLMSLDWTVIKDLQLNLDFVPVKSYLRFKCMLIKKCAMNKYIYRRFLNYLTLMLFIPSKSTLFPQESTLIEAPDNIQ